MAKRKRKAKRKKKRKEKTEVQEEIQPESEQPEPEVQEAAEGEAEPEEEEVAEEPITLFNRWSFSEVTEVDPGLRRYICLDPVIIPHTAGRMANKPFQKSKVNIVERLVNKCMRSGTGRRKIAGKYIRNKYGCGKKERAIKNLERAFEIVEDKTGTNPIQVLVQAIENCAPREETTTISYGGISYHKSVDVSPQRRVDLALRNIGRGTSATAFKSKRNVAEALADELILAARNDSGSHAVARKEETERVAMSAR